MNGDQSSGVAPSAAESQTSRPGGITGLLFTDFLNEDSAEWFRRVRSVVDELVIFVDDHQASDATRELAERIATRVYYVAPRSSLDAHIQAHLRTMVEACRTEWILRIDGDEELSPQWNDREWHRFLDAEEFTHFWLPRRWLTPSGNYLSTTPWWPDFQLRLFRASGAITFPSKVHEPTRIEGRGGCFRSLAIHHHVLRLSSRAAREAKVRKYEQLRPGGALGYYYLFEDYAPMEGPLPTAAPFLAETELLEMEELSPDEMASVSLTTDHVSICAKCGEPFWIQATVMNGSARPLTSAWPHPVNLAYHWLVRDSREVAIFDGMRSQIFPSLPASSMQRFSMMIMPPSEPGDYVLQLALVQEGVRWSDQVPGGEAPEYIVSCR